MNKSTSPRSVHRLRLAAVGVLGIFAGSTLEACSSGNGDTETRGDAATETDSGTNPTSDATTSDSDTNPTSDAATPDSGTNPTSDAATAILESGADSGTDAADAGPPPTLSSLVVSPLVLTPAFSPNIHDYAVRCSVGTNQLTLSWSADGSATAALVEPAAAGAEPGSVSLAEDAAAVIRVTDGGASSEYWIRCLPHDFPKIAVTTFPDAGSPTPGWYLAGNSIPGVDAGTGDFAMALDTNGTPVWYRREAYQVFNVDERAPNVVSYTVNNPVPGFGTDATYSYEIRNLSTGQVQTIKAAGGEPTDIHEFRVLANGDWMIMSYEIVSNVNLTGLSTYGATATIADCVLQEIGPTGNLVWEWHATDHIDPVKESTFPDQMLVGLVPVVDVYHFNSIEEASNGDLLVSARHLDAVFLIDRTTNKVKWKLGGAAYSKDGAQLLHFNQDGGFFRQHDARFLPNGQISLFDDETAKPGPARGVTYSLDFVNSAASVTWQYAGPVTSTAMGSTRVYADGDTVIGWGFPSSGTLAFTEVNAAGHAVLALSLPQGDRSYRVVKVPTSSLDIGVLRQAAGAH